MKTGCNIEGRTEVNRVVGTDGKRMGAPAGDGKRQPGGASGAGRVLLGCGIGLRREHHQAVLDQRPSVPWFEVISENYMVPGGRPRRFLESIRRDYPIAVHGVSLSIGAAEPLDPVHLAQLKELVRWAEPAIVSDHLCWSRFGGHSSHELMPLPRTEEAVRVAAAKTRQIQEELGRRILLENISTYFEFRSSELTECEFVAAVAEEADCDLLLDVNNVYVNARNHGLDPVRYIRSLPPARVRQIHLAGHEDHGDVVLDTHDHAVREEVWSLYELALERFGPVPTLIERDANLPELHVLLDEAARAQKLLDAARGRLQGRARKEPLAAAQRTFLGDYTGHDVLDAAARAERFHAPPQGSLEARWHTFAHGYATRVAESLENDYPAVRRILGAGPFVSLTARYLAACPPRSHDIGRAGDRLAGFLEGDPLTPDLPFLPDLARLEWALAEAFVARDVEPWSWEALTALGPERLADLPLAVAPGTALLRSDWPLPDLRATVDQADAEVSLALEGRGCVLLVHRDGTDVRTHAASPLEARLVELAAAGLTLAGIQEALGDDELPRLVESFRSLVSLGVFQKNDVPPARPAAP